MGNIATNNPNIRFLGYMQQMFNGRATSDWAAFIEAMTQPDTHGLLRAAPLISILPVM